MQSGLFNHNLFLKFIRTGYRTTERADKMDKQIFSIADSASFGNLCVMEYNVCMCVCMCVWECLSWVWVSTLRGACMVCFVKPQALIAAFLACSNRANKVARLGQTTNYNVLQIDNFACCLLHAACCTLHAVCLSYMYDAIMKTERKIN